MYGIVNKAIQDMLVEKFGLHKWELIKERSQVNIDFFLSTEHYDDAITYQLANAVSEELQMPLAEVMHAFGEWWVLRTGKEKYGGLMEAGGASLREFLINLPAFHNRVMLIYPKLTPPEFKVSHITENSIHVHYFSQRLGLRDFVHGLLSGLSKMYKTPVHITLLQSRDDGSDHEIFSVTW